MRSYSLVIYDSDDYVIAGKRLFGTPLEVTEQVRATLKEYTERHVRYRLFAL